MKGWRKIFHGSGNKERAGAAALVSDKIDFWLNTATRDKARYYITIKMSILQEDITIINIYAPSRAPKYVKQTLTEAKGEIVTQ